MTKGLIKCAEALRDGSVGKPKPVSIPAICAFTRHTVNDQINSIRCTTLRTSAVDVTAYTAPIPIPSANAFSARALETTRLNHLDPAVRDAIVSINAKHSSS